MQVNYSRAWPRFKKKQDMAIHVTNVFRVANENIVLVY
jgi:hypothetical protein